MRISWFWFTSSWQLTSSSFWDDLSLHQQCGALSVFYTLAFSLVLSFFCSKNSKIFYLHSLWTKCRPSFWHCWVAQRPSRTCNSMWLWLTNCLLYIYIFFNFSSFTFFIFICISLQLLVQRMTMIMMLSGKFVSMNSSYFFAATTTGLLMKYFFILCCRFHSLILNYWCMQLSGIAKHVILSFWSSVIMSKNIHQNFFNWVYESMVLITAIGLVTEKFFIQRHCN